MDENQEISRRRFQLTFIYGLSAAMGVALGAPAVAYLLVPKKSSAEAEWVEATDLSGIEAGTPHEVSFQRTRIDGWKTTSEKATAWVVKKGDNQVVAFAPQCTHLGCAYHWDDANHNFLCPCHTSRFSIDGKVLSGPAPRPLDRYAMKIEGTRLLLGTVEQSQG